MRHSSAVFAACALLFGCSESPSGPPDRPEPDQTTQRLATLVLREEPPPRDVTNAHADDPRAAELGRKLFFDERFSGPLLEEDNDGLSQTLGEQGETGRVSCAGCHVPGSGSFVDTRSVRGQISLAAGWTRRRTPALLDLAGVHFLGWDGRRDTAFSVVFGVIESPVEFNSSRLFVAQQIARHYRADYEEVFGPLPSLDAYAGIAPEDAGCASLPLDPYTERCEKPGIDDPDVTRVVVDMGKAIQAYTRMLTCGRSRFDAWMDGDEAALTAQEQAGARLFVNIGCVDCHAGPHLTDRRFHNVGVAGQVLPFTGIDTRGDRGAAEGLAAVRGDWLNSRGPFSDGDDGRLDTIPADLGPLQGAFRTPGLRCLGDRPSFMHNGAYRTLPDVIRHFDDGGAADVGDAEIAPLGLSAEEIDQLVAFLEALDGPGPDASLREAPALP
jgi:cytochrome c peroxidase